MIHTGENPYTCKVCFKTCSLNSSLKQQQIIHTDEKPYTCAICYKGFKLDAHLFNFKFNFILPKVNTDYIRQAQVLNIDNLRLIIYL